MIDIILDTLLDIIKIAPFLFVAFLIIEIIENKLSNKNKELISKSGKVGPLLGAILGLFPQCGFGTLATNLYVTRIISLGTLISIYLTTSDEMLPILISEGGHFKDIVLILSIKFIIGVISGVLIDLVYKSKEKINYEICEDEHCHCEEDGIIISSIIHTVKTLCFIAVITFILNFIFEYFGVGLLESLLLKNSIFSPFIASLIGLIPNCVSSVVLTELYLSEVITLSTTIAGLLTNSGVALLVLLKSNENIKENLSIISIVYIIGAISGVILKLFGI